MTFLAAKCIVQYYSSITFQLFAVRILFSASIQEREVPVHVSLLIVIRDALILCTAYERALLRYVGLGSTDSTHRPQHNFFNLFRDFLPFD